MKYCLPTNENTQCDKTAARMWGQKFLSIFYLLVVLHIYKNTKITFNVIAILWFGEYYD